MSSWLARARLPITFPVAFLLVAACGPQTATQTTTQTTDRCRVAAQGSARASEPSPGEPDFALFGFPRVAATQRFTPGAVSTVSAGAITVSMPADMYTEPLDFELLLGDEAAWQSCVDVGLLAIAPYAYRVQELATGNRVGRFDKTVSVSISDPRIAQGATYWLTSAANPPAVEASPFAPDISGSVLRVVNGGARAGWLVTVPKG